MTYLSNFNFQVLFPVLNKNQCRIHAGKILLSLREQVLRAKSKRYMIIDNSLRTEATSFLQVISCH